MPIERVDRPGESQEATGGKKKAKERWTEKKRNDGFRLCHACCLFGRVFRFILHRDGLLDCALVLLQHYFCGPSFNKMD